MGVLAARLLLIPENRAGGANWRDSKPGWEQRKTRETNLMKREYATLHGYLEADPQPPPSVAGPSAASTASVAAHPGARPTVPIATVGKRQ